MTGYVFAEEPADEGGDQPSAQPGEKSGAAVTKDGWWWTLNESPEDDTGFVPQEPPPSSVPEGTLPVAAAGGDPEKISAIEFRLDAQPGATVDSVVLALAESEESGAGVNEEDAAVQACQITEEFWADGEAASWETRPEYDCEEGSAEGTRDSDGTWTFDLTAMAGSWVDEQSPNPQSVVLVENADSPESFQVAFEGTGMEGIGIAAEATDGEAQAAGERGDGGTGAPGEGVAEAPGGSGAPSGAESSGSAPDGSDGAAAAAVDDGEAPSGADAPEAAPGEEDTQADLASGPAQPALYEGIPWPAWLLVPFALGAVYLLMLALGPRAEVVQKRKGHGVSRALERWARTGDKAAGGA